MLERGMDLLVRYGVEERGIQPRPKEVRALPHVLAIESRSEIDKRDVQLNLSHPAAEECDVLADTVADL